MQTLRRVDRGSAEASAELPLERVQLTPEDSVEARCWLTRDDHQLFSTGTYRMSVDAVGWTAASVPRAWWDIEIREPQNEAETKVQELAEGTERFRLGDYAAAAEHFAKAVAAASGEAVPLLALVGAYERLQRDKDAAHLLERVLASDDSMVRDRPAMRAAIARRAARAYVRAGDELSARRVLKSTTMTDEAIGRFIAAKRRR